MIWVDGRLVVERFDGNAVPPYRGYPWVQDGDKFAITLPRQSVVVEPGPAKVVAALWPARDISLASATYLAATLDMIGAPTLPVMPTVLSGQTIGPRVVRTLFHTDARTVQDDNLAGELHAAGVTHLSLPIFNSPGDNAGWDTQEKWLVAWNSLIKPGIDLAVANGLRIIGIGDDFFRNENELLWIHTGSFREFAIRHVAAYLRDCGVCDGVEMVDEVRHDPDGDIPGMWEPPWDYEPGEFLAWWRAEGGPPIAWPHLKPVQWEVPEFSDYSSRYYMLNEWRSGRTAPYGGTVWQLRNGIARAAADVPTSRPWFCLVSVNGPYYQKRVPGGDWQPGDWLLAGGYGAADVIAQVWLALAHGASGVRMYGYDFALWRNQRADQPAGEDNPFGMQTGSRPGDERWPGIVACGRAIGSREAMLTGGAPYVPTISGPWVSGRRGDLWWSVNTSERAHDAGVPGVVVTPVGEVDSSVVPAGCVILWSL